MAETINDKATEFHEDSQARYEAAQEPSGGDDRVTLDEMDSDEDRVEHMLGQGWSETTARRYFGLADPEAEATVSADTAVGYQNVEEREPVTGPQKEAAVAEARDEAIAAALADMNDDAPAEAAPAEADEAPAVDTSV